MEINEACEKAARYWLDLDYRLTKDGMAWCGAVGAGEEPEPEWTCPIIDEYGPLYGKEDIVHLASPWGMDLLLNAAEVAGFFVELSSGVLLYPIKKPHNCRIYKFKDEPWRRHGNRVACGESENRYHAIVYAFAKAADVLEGV